MLASNLLEIPVQTAVALAIAVPLVPLIIALVAPRVQRAWNHIFSVGSRSSSLDARKRELVSRLGALYFSVLLFVVGNMIAAFYQSMADIMMDVIDSGFIARDWVSIAIVSPWECGWMGSLPWYGQSFLPPEGSLVYHETWSWLFFSGGITDDATFFLGAARLVLITTFISGFMFLIPLALQRVRNSRRISLFLLTTGMLTSFRGLFGCFAQAFQLVGDSSYLQYGIRVVVAGQLGVVSEFALLLFLSLVIVPSSFVFAYLGVRLERTHRLQRLGSRGVYSVHVLLSYWMSLLCIVALV
jgi:hypothetical protein